MADILKQVGLDKEQGIAQLDDADAIEELQHTEDHWRHLGISSVPTVVCNMESALTGAQPVEVYKQMLAELIEK